MNPYNEPTRIYLDERRAQLHGQIDPESRNAFLGILFGIAPALVTIAIGVALYVR